jgi:hypothetical protein
MTGDALEVFNRRLLANGGEALARSDVEEPDGEFRLYRAVASESSMLAKDGEADPRIPVQVAP